MSGNQDRATGPGTAADWIDCVMQDLRAELDAVVARMKATPAADGDLALARRVRLVGAMARTVRSIRAIDDKPPRGGHREPEDEMKHRDDSPEHLERLRARVDADVDRLAARFEEKGMVVRPGEWPAARDGGDRVRAA